MYVWYMSAYVYLHSLHMYVHICTCVCVALKGVHMMHVHACVRYLSVCMWCMSAYVCLRMCAHVCTCMYICACEALKCKCMVHECTCVLARMCVCTCTCHLSVCMWCMSIYMCLHVCMSRGDETKSGCFPPAPHLSSFSSEEAAGKGPWGQGWACWAHGQWRRGLGTGWALRS